MPDPQSKFETLADRTQDVPSQQPDVNIVAEMEDYSTAAGQGGLQVKPKKKKKKKVKNSLGD